MAIRESVIALWPKQTETIVVVSAGMLPFAQNMQQDLTRLPPRESTLDDRWTKKIFGLSRIQPDVDVTTLTLLTGTVFVNGDIR